MAKNALSQFCPNSVPCIQVSPICLQKSGFINSGRISSINTLTFCKLQAGKFRQGLNDRVAPPSIYQKNYHDWVVRIAQEFSWQHVQFWVLSSVYTANTSQFLGVFNTVDWDVIKINKYSISFYFIISFSSQIRILSWEFWHFQKPHHSFGNFVQISLLDNF